MVIKIQPPSGKLEATVRYNERKVVSWEYEDDELPLGGSDEYSHVLKTRNVPDGTTLEDEFKRLALLNAKKSRGRKLENPAFHMSVNPGLNDRLLTESEVVDLIDDIMTGMGYGDCPYRIYKHTDIERIHYHVVSCRIGQDGKKVNDSFENRRMNTLAEDLAEKYGYSVGLEGNPSEQEKSTKQTSVQDTPGREKKKTVIPPFSLSSSEPVSKQMKDFHEEAMKWYFSTPAQYAAILRWRYNCMAEERENGFCYSGLDSKGKPASKPVSEKDLGIDASEDVIRKCMNTDMKKRRAQRERVEKAATASLEESVSFADFRKRMNKLGIYLALSYTDDGALFGLTWIDRATRCVFKGSETDVNLEWLKEAAKLRLWKIAPHKLERREKGQSSVRPRHHLNSEIERRKAEAMRKKMLNDKDERSNAQAIDRSELDSNPNNIKI